MHFNYYSWMDDEGRKMALLSFDELYSLAKVNPNITFTPLL